METGFLIHGKAWVEILQFVFTNLAHLL